MKVKHPRKLNIYLFFIQELQFTRMSVMDEGTKLMDQLTQDVLQNNPNHLKKSYRFQLVGLQ